jgi:ankyrin repeat protein
LIWNDADISARDRRGHTALYYAASKESRRIVRLLLKHGTEFAGEDLHFLDDQLDYEDA